MTTLAVGMLALDAALLFIGGMQFDRPWLFVPGAVCAAGAVGVVFLWRRHRRTLAEIEELRREAESIRALLKSHHFQN
jgi:hypothetical protein